MIIVFRRGLSTIVYFLYAPENLLAKAINGIGRNRHVGSRVTSKHRGCSLKNRVTQENTIAKQYAVTQENAIAKKYPVTQENAVAQQNTD
jgi:hypothetical protein